MTGQQYYHHQRWIFIFCLFCIAIVSGNLPSGTAALVGSAKPTVSGNLPCRFPISGEFYFEDKSQRILRIDESHFETKGDCVKAYKERDFYIVRNTKNADVCHRCILFLAFHTNVIRYKESPCIRQEADLETLCRRISGDSPLYTLFRTNPKPITCPIPLPATFAYTLSTSGTCQNDGLSIIDECSVPNRFRLSFVSCPNALKSRTHDEAFECIADWNHYSTYYFAARVVGTPFAPALGDYRCFIVDQATNRIGMSADSSCLELTSLDRASVVLTYKSAPRLEPSCDFPSWINGTRAWISTTSKHTVRVNKGRWTEYTATGESAVDSVCLEAAGEEYFIIKRSSDCDTSITCLKILRRSKDVITISRAPMAAMDMNLCKKLQDSERDYFSFDLLIRDETIETCPYNGLLFSEKCSRPLLSVGCNSPFRMNLTDICSVRFPDAPSQDVAITESFVCRANFRINNETFLIASSRRRFLCLKFWLKTQDSLVVDSFTDTACFNEALRFTKRLPERFEIVQTGPCPSNVYPNPFSWLLNKLVVPSESSEIKPSMLLIFNFLLYFWFFGF